MNISKNGTKKTMYEHFEEWYKQCMNISKNGTKQCMNISKNGRKQCINISKNGTKQCMNISLVQNNV